jgi:hypothetical protein
MTTTTTELKRAQREYRKAKTENDRVLSIEEKAKTIVLQNNIFAEEETGKRITKPSRDYLMSDGDFKKFIDLCYIERKKLGLDVPAENTAYCYTLPALKQAEDNLLDLALQILPKVHQGINLHEKLAIARNHWKYRQEFIDLTMQLAL